MKKQRDLSLTFAASGEQALVIRYSIQLAQLATQLAASMDVKATLIGAGDPRRPLPSITLN